MVGGNRDATELVDAVGCAARGLGGPASDVSPDSVDILLDLCSLFFLWPGAKQFQQRWLVLMCSLR